MSVSEQKNLTSAFNFLTATRNPIYDGNYKLSYPSITKLMKEINSRGHVIGLHPSYETFLNNELIVSEAKILKQKCDKEKIYQNAWGGRMHYLRFKFPETLYGWAKAGMDFESSLGFADRLGFRCGHVLTMMLLTQLKIN